ncbi:Uncharacterized protein Fot_36204 [Forsythia ovata]|uniref:Uncharacterized protein n=1 Tax=Forsythia ovata TaxID=205694 RepID=A0ABD1SNR2_9LAMI
MVHSKFDITKIEKPTLKSCPKHYQQEVRLQDLSPVSRGLTSTVFNLFRSWIVHLYSGEVYVRMQLFHFSQYLLGSEVDEEGLEVLIVRSELELAPEVFHSCLHYFFSVCLVAKILAPQRFGQLFQLTNLIQQPISLSVSLLQLSNHLRQAHILIISLFQSFGRYLLCLVG